MRECKADICAGLVGGADAAATKAVDDASDARKPLRDAGFSHVQATAALLESDGDGAKALALLQSGWALPPAEPLVLAAGAGRCPFGFRSGGAGAKGDGVPPMPPPPASSRTVQVNVKSIKDRKTWTVEVKLEDYLGELKTTIETVTGIALAKQRLVFKGKPLKEDVPLGDQGLQNDATLQLVMLPARSVSELHPAPLVASLRERYNARAERASGGQGAQASEASATRF